MSIITQGYGSPLLVTQGYGATAAPTMTFAGLQTVKYTTAYESGGFRVGGTTGIGVVAPGNPSYIPSAGAGVVLGDEWSIQSPGGATWSSAGITLAVAPVLSPASPPSPGM